MKKWTSVLWYIVISALAFAGMASWFAPKAIAWYFDPPVNIGINCRAATEWSMNRLQKAQGFGFICGAVFGLVLWLTLRARNRKRLAPESVVPSEPENF